MVHLKLSCLFEEYARFRLGTLMVLPTCDMRLNDDNEHHDQTIIEQRHNFHDGNSIGREVSTSILDNFLHFDPLS